MINIYPILFIIELHSIITYYIKNKIYFYNISNANIRNYMNYQHDREMPTTRGDREIIQIVYN